MTATTSEVTKPVRNFLAGLCIGPLFGSMAITFYGTWRWLKGAPKQPDPLHGIIYAYNNHGSDLYFSAAHIIGLYVVFWTIPLAFLGMLIEPKKNFYHVGFAARWELDDPQKIRSWTGTLVALAIIVVAWFFGEPIAAFLQTAGLLG